MTLRRAHGNGAPALLRAERRPLDEIPLPDADVTAEGERVARVRGKPFTRGNQAAKGRKPALAVLGLSNVDVTDPRYANALRQAARYRKRRCSELARTYGGELSAGASSMVASASLALAASRYCYALAAELGPQGAALFAQGAALADKARTAELTAIDLAERESKARVKETAATWDPLARHRTPKETT